MAIFQDCIDKAQATADFIKSLLTSDSSTYVNGVPSLRKIITDNKNKTGALWLSSKDYKKGDIVGHNNKIYYALRNNTNKNPETESSDWSEKTFPVISGSIGFKKICLFQSDGTILRGAETSLKTDERISAIEKIGTGHFKVHFLVDFANTDYIVVLNGITHSANHFINNSVLTKNVSYIEFKSYDCSDSAIAVDADTYSVSFIEI